MKKFTSLNISIKKIGILFCRYFTFVGCIFPSTVKALENDGTYISERSLTQDEMIDIFSQGYTKIITYYNHTYTFKVNGSNGLDYYHEVRTPAQLNEIRNSGYVGTSAKHSAMPAWRTISNPNSASILP